MINRSIYTKYHKSIDLDDFLFPVDLHNVYFDRDKPNPRRIPSVPYFAEYAKKFKAVVDEEKWNMLECVSNSYTLVTNEWALIQGLDIAQTIFSLQRDDDVRFWNGLLTDDRGACEMNCLIHKELNIVGVENHWRAFLHIENSYNRTSPLAYHVGFFFETMDEEEIPVGLLIPSLSVNFTANHRWKLDTILKKLQDTVHNNYKGRNIFAEFERMVRDLLDITVVDDEILPLFCKLAKIKKLNPKESKDVYLANVLIKIDNVAAKWIKKCNCNAYAALCAYADFASKYADDIQDIFKEPSAYQSALGALMDELLKEKYKLGQNFSLDEFIGPEARAVKNQIKVICSSNH